MTAAPKLELAAEQIHTVPLSIVDESPFNHRRTWGNLEELAESMKQTGQLQAGLARPVGKRIELVFAHRRKRALELAGIPTINLVVREMTDEQAAEANAVENLQRTDLHPLEEAEGFEQLHKLGWSADAMAAKIGKSRAYVFERMKLLSLCKKLREAFYKDEFGASVGLYLARLPSDQLQLDAWKAIQPPPYDREYGITVTARRAQSIISERFMLRLVDAPFDRADKDLVRKAGPCTTCPKRTGNQKELFADVKSADVCTDPPCFQDKVRAQGKRDLEEASYKGVKVLEGKAGAVAIDGSSSYQNGTYVKPTEKLGWDGKTFAQLARGSDVKPVLAVGRDGLPVELLPRKAVLDAAKKNGLLKKNRTASGGSGSSMHQQQKRERAAAQSKRVATYAIMGAICEKACASEPKKGFWSMLATALVEHVSHDQGVEILKRRAGDDEARKSVNAKGSRGQFDTRKKLLAALGDLPRDEGAIRAFAVELAIAGAGTLSFHSYGSKELGKPLLAASAYYGLDANELALQARRAEAKETTAKKGVAKRAKKATRAGKK